MSIDFTKLLFIRKEHCCWLIKSNDAKKKRKIYFVKSGISQRNKSLIININLFITRQQFSYFIY